MLIKDKEHLYLHNCDKNIFSLYMYVAEEINNID